MGKILSFKPFLARLLDGAYVRFKCPKCSCNSCVKLSYNGLPLDKFCFLSGNYMCSNCGASSYNGKEFIYYNPCFYVFKESVQLTLF